MFEKLRSPFNEKGLFSADDKIGNQQNKTELDNESFFQRMISRKKEITDLVTNYYNSTQYTEGISKKRNGYQKQLLIDTIDRLGQQYPQVTQLKNWLMNTAALESSFKLNSTSKASTASGWFGFLDSTKKTVLKKLGVSATRQQFNNNPELQVLAAVQLYNDVMRQATKDGSREAAHRKGYSDGDIAHAYWLNPTWAKAYFKQGKVLGADAFGTTVPKYLKMVHNRK